MIRIINQKSMDEASMAKLLSDRNIEASGEYLAIVKKIVDEVRDAGDSAVVKYTAKFDWADISGKALRVSDEELEQAKSEVDDGTKELIRLAVKRVTAFHEKQKQNSWFDSNENGTLLGQMVRPLDIVGVYVPGGKASYPSSVIMNAVPAKVAGVNKIVMTTPSDKNGKINSVILFAAMEAGVDEIYKVGGAQAIAAMALGTETLPKVDKIVGPGNIFVALAKKLVYGLVDIDMIAGPSEILIIADASANPEYIAADLLSQAEHDEMAAAILITVSEQLALQVKDILIKQLEKLPRKAIAEKAIKDYSYIIIADDLDKAVELSNLLAPEHLELCVEEPAKYLGKVRNAGAVFVGNFSPEPLGDYLAGPSHVLPTSGTARFFSPLSVDHFIKKTSLIWFDEKSMKALGDDVIKFAGLEGFEAHANSIKVRMSKETKWQE